MAKLLAAGVIVLAVADFVVAEDADVDVSKRINGASRIGVIGKAVLRAKLAIDLIENDAKFGEGVGKEHGASRGFRDGLQSVFAGGITPAFVFHCANQNGVKKSV